jgi:Ca2+-binding EF-hand superfamily protein
MGNFTSRNGKLLTDNQLKKMWSTTFVKLGFTRTEILSLYSVFREIALVSPDCVAYDEMLMALRTENTHFSRSLFQSFMMSKRSRSHNKVYFKDFVKSVWNFCSLPMDHMGMCTV